MKNQRIIHVLTIVLFVLPLALGLVLFVALPDKNKSEQENRVLQELPLPTAEELHNGTFWKELANGKFSSDMNDYFADQFPARDTFVGIKGVAELIIGKGENNGVVLGKDGVLLVRWVDAYVSRLIRVNDTDYYSKDNIAAQADTLNKLSAELEAQEIPLTVVIPPRTLDVYGAQTSYPMQIADALWADINAGLDRSVNYLDLREVMQQATADGEYVYYRTDHHWTTKGAYLAYGALMTEWGREADIIPESNFTVEKVEDFYGTTWSRAGFKFVEPDTLEIWHFEGEDDYTVTEWIVHHETAGEGTSHTVFKTGEGYQGEGFYNRAYLAEKDKYSVFLDGTHGILTVNKNTEEPRQTLLVLKDSFLNSMVPFLSQHYDLVVVNLSAGGILPLSAYIEQFGCDGVLIMYNAENMTKDNALASVSYAKLKN